MKRLMSFLLIAGIVSGTLAGCGGDSSGEESEKPSNDTTSITQLKDAITSDLRAKVAAYQTAFLIFPFLNLL